MTGTPPPRTAEHGSITLEVVVLAPALLLLLALLIYAGRNAMAIGVVDQAAADAARAASLQRTPEAGYDAATEVARSSLSEQGLSCLSTVVDIDTAGLEAPVGQSGRVSVTISCRLQVADLPLPIPPIDISSTAISPVDTYRERR